MNIMKKVLITGGTGGIGGAVLKLLHELGWEIYAPVRNLKTAGKILGLPNVHIQEIDFTNQEKINEYISSIAKEVVIFDFVALLAGGTGPNREFFDSEFPGENEEEQIKNSIAGHMESSVNTKKRILKSLVFVYGESLKQTVLATIGSHAESFSDELTAEYNEFGYRASMIGVDALTKEYEPFFKRIFIDKPGLVRTPLTESNLADALADPKNPKKEADEYAREFFAKTGL